MQCNELSCVAAFRPLVLIDHETALNDGDMATLQAQVANGVLARTGPRKSGSSSNLVESDSSHLLVHCVHSCTQVSYWGCRCL